MQRNLRIRAAANSAIRQAMEAQGFVEVETPDARTEHAGGRPRVHRAEPPAARLVLRAAAEPAAVQAVADGRRHRPLLPDGPMPARRGPARRSPVRVHATRRRDELRQPGRRAPGDRRRGRRRCRSAGSGARRDRQDHVARRDEPLRHRQARPALRDGARRAHRRVLGDRVQGVRRRGDDQGHQRRRARPTTTAATSSTP